MHLLAVWNIIPLYNLENRTTINDSGTLILFILTQTHSVQALLLIPMSLTEPVCQILPISLMYQFALNYGGVTLFHKYMPKATDVEYIEQDEPMMASVIILTII